MRCLRHLCRAPSGDSVARRANARNSCALPFLSLLTVDLPDGRRIDYAYAAKGQRTEKRINGRVVEAYQWLDPLRLEEFFDGQRWWRLAYDSERPGRGSRTPVGVTNGDDSYLLLCDQVGTPRALATLDGNIVQTMQYASFGNPLRGLQGPVRLPLGFAGGLFDADTGPSQL